METFALIILISGEAWIIFAIQQLKRRINKMAGELDALTAEVANNTTVEKSALALIQGFAAQLAAAGTDPVKLKALARDRPSLPAWRWHGRD
jgi:nitrogenase subunit NifH